MRTVAPVLAAFVITALVIPSLGQGTDRIADQVQADPAKPEFPVKIAFEIEKRNGDAPQRVLVTLTIQDGYHLLANPTGNSNLGNLTTLSVKGKGNPVLLKVTYPKGELVKDAIVGDYFIYKGKVTLEAILQRSNEDTEPAEMAVRVFPVDARGCLWPIKALGQEIP